LWRYTGLLERSLEHVDALLMPGRFAAQRHREAGINRPMHVLNSFSSLGPDDSGGALHQAREDGGATLHPVKPLFVYAGRLEASKGIWHLLEAFRERPCYELLIAGNGVLAEQLKSRFADCAHIRFLGVLQRAQVAALLREAVAVVSPSWGPETFPLVNIEAMSCGTPVIARRGGGSVESIESTGGGLIYDEPQQLLQLVDRIASDPELREELAHKAREGYAANFSEARWMEQYFDLIRNITAAKSARQH
jgi:glycosyltransferase involved in cell wall biosynthesis